MLNGCWFASVAQLDRALVFGTRGWGFKSLRAYWTYVDLKNSRWVFPAKEANTKSMPRIVYLTERAKEITARLMIASPNGPYPAAIFTTAA